MYPKLIVRIKGGLGNQLFCYAAARRLALKNNAELVIDDTSGFIRDLTYGRKYALNTFNITARKATPEEKLEPFERVRRGILKFREKYKPFDERIYIEQQFSDFDERILNLKIQRDTYIDGLWQSELYFSDIEDQLRKDLKIIPPTDILNAEMFRIITGSNSVAVHVRWFSSDSANSNINVATSYYNQAIRLTEEKLTKPIYFVFSDNPVAAKQKITFPNGRVVFISHNFGDETAYADLWLISQCRHIIMANSTFSWWGAWLSGAKDYQRLILFPRCDPKNSMNWSWDYRGQMPTSWMPITVTE